MKDNSNYMTKFNDKKKIENYLEEYIKKHIFSSKIQNLIKEEVINIQKKAFKELKEELISLIKKASFFNEKKSHSIDGHDYSRNEFGYNSNQVLQKLKDLVL